MSLKYPKYKDLPIKPGAPAGSAWGVFDKDGKKDVYGTLNFITREALLEARKEFQTGESVVLNLPLHLPWGSSRINLEHKLITKGHGFWCCDDELTLNTQRSSQWDGLLHWANQDTQEFYNGVKYEDAADTKKDLTLGIQSLSERGGIVARGILLDFVRYAERHGIVYDPCTSHPIYLSQLKEMIQEENLEVRQGDILVLRTGMSKWNLESKEGDVGPYIENTHIGVDPTPELLAWIWDNNFAAVASDAIAFEVIPAPKTTTDKFLSFHGAAIAGWGMPIGELLDLEALAKVAEKNQRWSFLLTVCPLNVKGGAATIANTMAIF